MARFHPVSHFNKTASERLPSKRLPKIGFLCVLSAKAGCVFPLDHQGVLRICVHPARESVGVQAMTGFYPRDTFPEANIHMWLHSAVTSRLSAKKPRV